MNSIAIPGPAAALLRWMLLPRVANRPASADRSGLGGEAGQRHLFTILQVATLAPLAGSVAWIGDDGPVLAAMMARARPDLLPAPVGAMPDVVACVDGALPDDLADAVRHEGIACWLEAGAGALDRRILGARLRQVGGLARWGREAWWAPGWHAPGPPPLRLAEDEAGQEAVDRMALGTTRTPLRELRV